MATSTSKNGSVRTETKASGPGAEDLHVQVAALRSDVEALTRLLREMAGDRVSSVKTQVEDAADETRSRMEEQAQHVADVAEGYRQEAESAVKANPTTALGIATGIGFLAGLLLARR